MEQERGHASGGHVRQKPDPLDVWFRWVASLATAALIGFCLVSVFHIKPTDRTSAAHYHPHVVG